MIEFLTNYWLAVLPTALTGVVLFRVMKKARDEKLSKEKALVTVAARRKQQG